MIEAVNLTKIYRGGLHALKSVSFSSRGKINTIIGRNGAGKTTLTRILSTQLMPSSGTATINGFDILTETEKVRRSIVSIPQEASPLGILTALEQVKLFLIARGLSFMAAQQEAVRALDLLGLREFKNATADTLSGGMKRKIFVAMALGANADVVFLDEPTTGLDPISRIEVWSAVKEIHSEIFLTTHYMEEAQQLSDYVFLVDSGTITDRGTVRELLDRFRGKVRVESTSADLGGTRIGNLYIRYEEAENAADLVKKGYTVKPITLDDIFLQRGVSLES
ncbi:MAG TPA: ABC transporter ATP-binding protein [Thermoplasmataceae archaeon]|nr:ABC transporter ATP-binding protein [Thermoplasmatales archaeon AK]HLH85449.1 ABC transporter ATP-binding protein [Thermoplasmataceae archaeon]